MSEPRETKYADGTSRMNFHSRTVAADCVDWHDLAEFAAWLDGIKARIPQEHADSARIQFEAVGPGDFDREVQITVCYWKPTEEPK